MLGLAADTDGMSKFLIWTALLALAIAAIRKGIEHLREDPKGTLVAWATFGWCAFGFYQIGTGGYWLWGVAPVAGLLVGIQALSALGRSTKRGEIVSAVRSGRETS